MFKKMRNKLLLINMAAICAVMLIAFTSVLAITYGNVKKEIKGQLDITKMDNMPDSIIRPDDDKGNLDVDGKDEKNDHFAPKSISFRIVLDENDNIVEIYSPHFSDLDEDTANSLLTKADTKADYSIFKYEGNYYSFIHYGMNNSSLHGVVFVDVTNNMNVLLNFVYAFLFVAVIALVLIYFLSRYFADKAISPIVESFDKQRRFVSDASHELKTPLTIINANIDLVLSSPDDTINNQKKWLQFIKEEGIRMSKLTNDLLYLSRADNDDKLLYSNIDLSKILENCLLSIDALLYEKDLILNQVVAQGIHVYGNTDQLKQVILVLLDNAIKYNNEHGHIDVSLQKIGKDVTLTVCNSGKMISDDEIKKIFDRFYRTDDSRNRNTGGFGLGLAIAKTIVDQHNGKIEVCSNDGLTEIRIKLAAI